MASLLPDILKSGTVPRHIAVIMDGNGRWAKKRGLLRPSGHRAGGDAVERCISGCDQAGVKFLTLYAFSTENWKRPKTEITALMSLLASFLKDKTPKLMEKNVRLQAIGRIHGLPKNCQEALQASIDLTSGNTGLTLVLALNYGAREEIVDAIKSLLLDVNNGAISAEKVDADAFARHLYTKAYPDPDLLIRTSGEMRLSNFLLWQISYAEIVVLEKLWPDFAEEDVFAAIGEFQKRHRRYGAVS